MIGLHTLRLHVTKRAWLRPVLLAVTFMGVLGASAAAVDKPVVGRNGIISAGHPLAVMAGMKVLASGGNACDAAVATSTVLSIAMTDMMGPLGSGYALLWDADAEELSVVDYNGVAPRKTDPKLYDMAKKRRGILAPTVPGALMGWEAIHSKCGTKPWAELWQDAIDLAANGNPIDLVSADTIRRFEPELGSYPTWANEFLIDDRPPPAGYLLKRPDVAKTYEQFAAMGSDALYRGPVGEQLTAFMQRSGGLITAEDLADYRVKWVEPITTTYRGYEVYGSPPSSSSLTWMQILNFVEGFDLASFGHNTAEYLRVLVEATKHAYLDGYRYNGDPSFVAVPTERLLSKPYAREVQQDITRTMRRSMRPVKSAMRYPVESTATSHMSIIDKWGNAVSMTNTLGSFFGAGPIVEGTGLVMSNGMDWFDIDVNIWTGEEPGALVMAPGKRNRWTLSPGMIFNDDTLFMVVGGAAAEATMWGIAQPILNVIDFDLDAQTALDAPRFGYGDISHYGGGTEVVLEPGISEAVRAKFKDWGYDVPDPGQQRNPARGVTNLVVVDPQSGVYWGGAAPDGRDFVAAF